MSDLTPTAMRCDAITVTSAEEPAVALFAEAPDAGGWTVRSSRCRGRT